MDRRKKQLHTYNFWIQTKQSKREIIIWAIITFIITFFLSHYLLEPGISYIDDKYGSKPNIISNIGIHKKIEINDSGLIMQNVKILFYLTYNYRTLIFVNSSDTENVKQFYNGIMSTNPDSICSGCSKYTFLLKNMGNKKANKVEIDIRASSIPKLEIDNPKMIRKECGGILNSKGCYIVFENIYEKEEVNFILSTNEASDLFVTKCIADEKYFCDIQILKIHYASINPEVDYLYAGFNPEQVFNKTNIKLPTLKNYPPKTLFYFDPNQSSFKIYEDK